MTARTNIRRVAFGSAIGVMVAVGVAPAALAGSTGDDNVFTPNVEWDEVTNNGFEINDAYAFYDNFEGTGLGIYGWAEDAFDGFFDEADNTSFFNYGATNIPLDIDPVSDNFVDGGLSTIVGQQQLDFGSGVTFDVDVALEIIGSFARWSYDFVSTGTGDPALLNYSLTGNLGSDDGSVYVSLGAGQMVSYQSLAVGYGIDPILGWSLTTDGTANYVVTDGNDDFTVAGTDSFTLTVGQNDWDPCSFDAAYNAMVAAVPTFGTSFGTTLPSHYTLNCLSFPAVQAVAGTPLNALVPIVIPDIFVQWFADWDPDYFDDVFAQFVDLPAGVNGALEFVGPDPYLRLTGVMPAGDTTVDVLVYSNYEFSVGGWPFMSTITLDAVLSDTGPTEETPWLAGLSAALIVVGAGLIAVRRLRH